MLRSIDAIHRATVSRKHSSTYCFRLCNILTTIPTSSRGFVQGSTDLFNCKLPYIAIASLDHRYDQIYLSRGGVSYTQCFETAVTLKSASRAPSSLSQFPTCFRIQSHRSSKWPSKRSAGLFSPIFRRCVSSSAIKAATSVPSLFCENQNDNSDTISVDRDHLNKSKPYIETDINSPYMCGPGDIDSTEYREAVEPFDAPLKDTANPSVIKNAYEGTRKSRENRRSRERELRATANGLTWKDILEELKVSTTSPVAESGKTEVHRLGMNATIKFVAISARSAEASSLSSGIATEDSQFPKPAKWSSRSLTFYIRSLCRGCSPCSNIKGDVDAITHQILEAFYETRDQEGVATIEAFNMALKFLHRYRKLPEARELFGLMENSSCAPDVSTINVFIHNAAEEQNIAAFQLWLRRMRQRNISPDCSTWAALLEITPSLSKRQEVAWEIERKQLAYDRHTAALVLQKVIPYSFRPYLEEGGDPESYLDTLQQIFGQGFDNSRVVRQMLDSLASQGRFNEATLLVKSLALHGYRPSVSDLNILLLWSRKHLNADAAIELVEITCSTWDVKLNRTTMAHLFKLFWRARMYNTLWATWIYACMWNFVSFEMKSNILWSMQQSLQDNPNTVRERWESSAGAVVLGASVPKPAVGESFDHAIKELFTGKVAQHRSEIPVEPFPQILKKALHEDKSWTEKGLRTSSETPWKIENKTHIPVVFATTNQSRMEEEKKGRG